MGATHIHHQTSEKTNSFLSGVFVLTVANVLVKVIGLFFKIPISHILGDEGMGYFNAAYTIYTWLYMLSTAGFPVAISILVAKELAQGKPFGAKRVGKLALIILSVVGGVLGGVMAVFAPGIATAIGSPNASISIMLIAPTLLLICISSAMRGYYQGYGYMHPTAFSQIFEAAGKLLIGVLLALYAHKKGYSLSVVAGFAIMGVTIGTFVSMLYLVFVKPRAVSQQVTCPSSEEKKEKMGRYMPALLKIAVPITLGATVMSLTNVIDLGMIMRRLQFIGYTPAQSASLYGNYTTLVVPMFNLPSVFVYAIAYAIVPAISSALAKQNKREANRLSQSSLLYTAMIALPCALGIGTFSYQILATVFRDDSARLAAPYLTMISPGIVFICLLAVTNAVLQAYGHPRLPIISLLIGGTVKIIVGYILIGNPKFGMVGAPIGTVLCYVVASLINLLFILSKTDIRLGIVQFLLKPLWASALSVGVALLLDFATANILSDIIRLAVCVLLAVALYLFIVIKMGLMRVEDILKMPAVERFLGIFHKRKTTKPTISP